MFMYVQVQVHLYMRVEAGGQDPMSSSIVPPCFLCQGVSPYLELTLAQLADGEPQRSSCVTFPRSKFMGVHCRASSFLMWALGIQAPAFMPHVKQIYLVPCPQLPHGECGEVGERNWDSSIIEIASGKGGN